MYERNFLPSHKELLSFILIYAFIIASFYINNIYSIKILSMIFVTAVLFALKDRKTVILVFFVVADNVFGFFTEAQIDLYNVGAPIIGLGPGIAVGFKDLIIVVALITVLLRNQPGWGKEDFVLIVGVLAYSLGVGFFLDGFSSKVLINYIFRQYLVLIFFLYIRQSISISESAKMLHMLSIFLLPILVDQIYATLTGQRILSSLLGLNLRVATHALGLGFRATPYGANVVFFSFLYGLFLLHKHNREKVHMASEAWGALITILSLISIILSATRGQIAVFSVILLVGMQALVVKFRSTILMISIALLMYFVLSGFGFDVTYFQRTVIGRIESTVNPILQGNIADANTSGREQELPILLTAIKKSPFVGYGLSNKYYNNNFGFLNTILQFGFFGFTIIIFTLFKWYISIRNNIQKLRINQEGEALARVCYAGLSGMFVGYAFTYNYFTGNNDFDVLRLMFFMILTYSVAKIVTELHYNKSA